MEATGKEAIQGKLTRNWKDPYMIIEEVCPAIFRLIIFKRDNVPRTWPSDNLSRHFILTKVA